MEPELSRVAAVLEAGQRSGELGPFDARVVAVSMKAALDGLLGQLAAHPDLDLTTYGESLVALFDAAVTAPRRTTKGTAR